MITKTAQQLVCAAGAVKEQRRQLPGDSEAKETHDAGRSLVGVQHNLLS